MKKERNIPRLFDLKFYPRMAFWISPSNCLGEFIREEVHCTLVFKGVHI